jgi:uncharacterized membrane protein
MIGRLVLWLVGVVMMAGIVHIVTVFGVPSYAVNDPWKEIGRFGPVGGFVVLPPVAGPVKSLPGLDPAMAQAVCRFSLEAGPIRIKAMPPDVYWSLSLFDRRGLHVWGFDNRGAGQKAADVVIADGVQMAQLRENPPEEFEDVAIVDWKGWQGIALLQIFRERPSLDGDIAAALKGAECRAAPLS